MAAAIMILLLLTAMMAGYQKYSAAVRIQQAAQGGSNEQWLDQGDKNPHSAAHYGNYAFKPAGPLSYFDNGISNFTGTAVFMEAHRQNFAIGRPASDQSSIARFGDLSGAMILQLLLRKNAPPQRTLPKTWLHVTRTRRGQSAINEGVTREYKEPMTSGRPSSMHA